jgi:2-amino-4-hydroxy-6-hydroxymethyldihydropteridine diphosphokinase
MPHITAYIGIGSNLGIPKENCTNAIEKISSTKDIKIISKSSFYRTEPIGGVQQGWFVNSAIEIKTDLSPENLLSVLLNLELAMGRIRKEKWGPRLIDLDLLFYGNLVLENKSLTLPHPEIQNRKFVLVPMSEIAENLIHPTLKKTIKTLLQESSDVTIVKKIKNPNPNHRDQSFP